MNLHCKTRNLLFALMALAMSASAFIPGIQPLERNVPRVGTSVAQASPPADCTPYRWLGGLGVRVEDQEQQLYCMNRRFYSASLMRFLTRDPSGLDGGPNAYLYAKNGVSPIIH